VDARQAQPHLIDAKGPNNRPRAFREGSPPRQGRGCGHDDYNDVYNSFVITLYSDIKTNERPVDGI
jgi:hypothetical protein